MPRTIKDIFNDYPNVEIVKVFGFNDGKPFAVRRWPGA
jgi:hypothetical protein